MTRDSKLDARIVRSDDLVEIVGVALGHVRRELLAEIREQSNDIRRRLDLPLVKPRVRIAAPRGRTW